MKVADVSPYVQLATEFSSPDSLTNLQADLVFGGFSIILHLDSQPELDGGAEILRERNPRFRRDAGTGFPGTGVNGLSWRFRTDAMAGLAAKPRRGALSERHSLRS